MESKINWKKIKKIFFVGIKGVGMTPLALIAKEANFHVSGSDLDEEFITDEPLREANIKVVTGFDKKDLEVFFEDTGSEECLVITTGAHSGYENPQVKRAKEMGVGYLNQGQALGVFMSGEPFERSFDGVTVTGSHGKTSIASLASHSFMSLGLDPTYSVGSSKIFPTGLPGHFGKGNYFVAEGDEYVGEPVFDKTPKILYQKPKFAIVNNIDFDHPDIYSDIEEIKEVFIKFVNGMRDGGAVFINSEDDKSRSIIKDIKKSLSVVTYGSRDSDFELSSISENLGRVDLYVKKGGIDFGSFILNIPGRHNALNALSAIALLDFIGTDKNLIKSAISSYKGCKRRMEFVGKTKKGGIIIDDYGHHPKEIKVTLNALKKFYGKKIACVFQSHTYSRTRKLLSEFANSFDDADRLILVPIFKSQRDTESDILTNKEFVNAFKKSNPDVKMFDSLSGAADYLNGENLDRDYIILTIGAGDVYKIGYMIKE